MKNIFNPAPDHSLSRYHRSSEISIIGISQFDKEIIIHESGIIEMSPEQIESIRNEIIAFFFDKAGTIVSIKDEDAIEFIEGIKAIIIDEKITNIEELRIYIEGRMDSFDANNICESI